MLKTSDREITLENWKNRRDSKIYVEKIIYIKFINDFFYKFSLKQKDFLNRI